MINAAAHKGALFKEIRKNLGADHGMSLVGDGRDAALATLTCMRDVAKILPPRHIIDVYEKSFSPEFSVPPKGIVGCFGSPNRKGHGTGGPHARHGLDSAWAAGGGSNNHGHINPAVLRGHYEDSNFVRSVTVDEIEQEIASPAPVSGGH